MKWWQYLLFPFAVLYDSVTRLRNQLYALGLIKAFQFEANVLSVGNLSVGGTGKSPMITYLIDYLSGKGMEISTLSRGYGRKTKGFRLASPDETARTIGDEPLMFYQRYSEKVHVTVGEERVLAIPEILYHFPETDVILLDDAFQHQAVKPSLSIMLTTWQKPFYYDFILPAGLLRESRKGAARADVIVVTKCPSTLTEAERRSIKEEISKYSGAQVFFTRIEYGDPVPVFKNGPDLKSKVVAISGIASPELFHRHVTERCTVKISHSFPDHHHYSKLDVKGILNELDEDTSLITTEKDMVKLRSFDELCDRSCFYVPIRVKFIEKETLFHSVIDQSIKEYKVKPIDP